MQSLRRDMENISAMAKALCDAPIDHIFSEANIIQVWTSMDFSE
jgi:hypothetical protein